jgi:hypothetical protein
MTQQNLPERLSICEQGTYQDDVFVPTGLWEAQDDDGTSYCVSSQERGIERWLVEAGYQDTGDGIRYQRKPHAVQI